MAFATGLVRTYSLLAVCAFFLAACSASRTQVLDASADDNLGGTGLESGDVRGMAEKISRGVNRKIGDDADAALIAVMPIINESRFRVDTDIIRKKLTRDLVRAAGSATYLARDVEDAIAIERRGKREGRYDHKALRASMLGADYFLIGEMHGISKTAWDGQSDYLLYSFELVDAESGAIVWADDFETKKRGVIAVLYR